MFKWIHFDRGDYHITYLPIGLPIASLDFRNLNVNTNGLDFHKAASRYIDERITENA